MNSQDASNHNEAAAGSRADAPPPAIHARLSDNRQWITERFRNCNDLIILDWQYGPGLEHTAFSAYYDSLVQTKKHNYMKQTLQDLVRHIVGPATDILPEDVIHFFNSQGVSAESAALVDHLTQAEQHISEGRIVIFFDTWERAISYKASGVEGRQISEPVAEPVVQGPRESTVENLMKNIGLLRTRLRSANFKLHTFECGKETKTTVAFGYLEGAVNPETLAEFKSRIAGIEREDILETAYVEDWIEDSPYSPFPQCRYTERPDTATAALMDGKIIVLVSGSPSILICPALLVEFFTNSEDYYQRTIHASAIRLLRLAAFLIALTLPSIYIAFSTFHPELLPTVLLLAVLESREGIPFPAVIEALLMEFFFELLREAGIRLPRPIGSAVSIVGALVIGQAAIQAKIASPMMIIIVASTGIASFSIPQYNIAIALRLLRFPLMLLAASLGGFGLMIGFLLIYLHVSTMRVLGQPYYDGLFSKNPGQLRDIVIRISLKSLLRSPRNRHMHKRRNSS